MKSLACIAPHTAAPHASSRGSRQKLWRGIIGDSLLNLGCHKSLVTPHDPQVPKQLITAFSLSAVGSRGQILSAIMSAIGSLVFCTDCGNLLDASSGDENAILACEVCGTKNKGQPKRLQWNGEVESCSLCNHRHIIQINHHQVQAHSLPISAKVKTVSCSNIDS